MSEITVVYFKRVVLAYTGKWNMITRLGQFEFREDDKQYGRTRSAKSIHVAHA